MHCGKILRSAIWRLSRYFIPAGLFLMPFPSYPNVDSPIYLSRSSYTLTVLGFANVYDPICSAALAYASASPVASATSSVAPSASSAVESAASSASSAASFAATSSGSSAASFASSTASSVALTPSDQSSISATIVPGTTTSGRLSATTSVVLYTGAAVARKVVGGVAGVIGAAALMFAL